jgi:hypothetical protein
LPVFGFHEGMTWCAGQVNDYTSGSQVRCTAPGGDGIT